MINANGIELMAGRLDPPGVQAESARLRTAATSIRETGENVVSAWTHGLNPHVYNAPEGDRLRLATRPVQTETAQFAWQLWQVAGALADYATETAAIKVRLLALLSEARSFLAQADPMGSEWLKDDDMVDRNNELEAGVRAQAEALAAAEERCAGRIHAAYGGHAPTPICTGTPSSPPPWGTSEKSDDPWYEDAWNGIARFGHGVWDVTWGAFSTLAFVQGKDKALDAWKGLGEWALSSAVIGIPGAQGALMFPSVRNMVWKTHKDQVKGLTAWDEWRRDPARAGGQVFGNLLLLATLKKTGPRATTMLGRAGQQALTAARYLDPMTAVPAATMRSLGLARQLGDLIKTKLHTDIPEIASPSPASSRPGVGEFRDPNGGFEPVDPNRPKTRSWPTSPHPDGPQGTKEPSRAGAPRSHDPQETNSSHTRPSDAPSVKEPAAAGGHEPSPKDPSGEGPRPGDRAPVEPAKHDNPPPADRTPEDAAIERPKDPEPGVYRGDDGRLHRIGEPKEFYLSEDGKRHHIYDENPDRTFRDDNFGLRDRGTGHFVDDPLAARPWDFKHSKGDWEPYSPSPAAVGDLHRLADLRSVMDSRRRGVRLELNKLLDRFQIKNFDDVNSSKKVNEQVKDLRRELDRNPALSPEQKASARMEIHQLRKLANRYNALGQELGQVSEQLGMVAAKDFISHKLGGDLLTPPDMSPGRPGTLDAVGVTRGNHLTQLHVIEAKGGGSVLAGRRVEGLLKAQQGSPEYLNFELSVDPDLRAALEADPDLRAHLQKRLDEGKLEVHYYVLHASEGGKVRWAEFDLTRDGQKFVFREISGLRSPLG